MGLTSIFRGFAAMLFIVGLAMLAPLAMAFASGEDAGAYLFGVLACLILAAGAYAASLGRAPPSDFRGALIVVLLWWTAIPAAAAIPFAMGSLSFADAYYEAVTAMTTTGGWLSDANAVASRAGALWRAELQWLGGFASIAIAAAIFIRPAFIGINTLLTPFPRGDGASYLRPLRHAAAFFITAYILATLAAYFALLLAGAPSFDAAIMALSTIASGGFVPAVGGLEAYAPSVSAALFPFIVLSGVNFVLIARLLPPDFSRRKERLRDMETGAFLAILVVVAIIYWLLVGAGGMDRVSVQFFNAASVLSTNGHIIGQAPPIIFVLVTAIIGGAAVSTAGGFKILRWIVIMRRAHEEIRRLVAPRAIFGQRSVSNELGVWMHFIVITMTLGALVIALSLGGHSLETAATAATAALSNTGPLLRLAEQGAEGYAVFDGPSRFLLLTAMILGRFEAAAALALINRAFWRA